MSISTLYCCLNNYNYCVLLLLFVVDDSEPKICLEYVNDNCWNGTANVTLDNVYFTDKTVEGQSMYYHTVACQ